MLRNYSHEFFIIGQALQQFEDLPSSGNKLVPAEGKTRILNAFVKKLIPSLEEIGLHVSVKQAERVVAAIKKSDATSASIRIEGGILRTVVEHEASFALFLHVPSPRVEYYDDAPLFGEKVAQRFPKTTTDLQEAGKCFALGRYTATVFHLMRVMESAVQFLGKRLGIAFVGEKNWHNILDEVDKAIKSMPISNPRQKATRNRFAEASAHLRMVKDAWRNDVMHPKETYTEEEAERVFRNVKDFMVHLATKI